MRRIKTSVSGDETHISRYRCSTAEASTWLSISVSASSCVNFFKVYSFDFVVTSYYYTASSTVTEMCKQALHRIRCQAVFFCLGRGK